MSSLTDTLFGKIQSRILSGELSPGDRLPTQKDIAIDEEVSRTVVREAVARLEASGLVEARQGSGVYVADGARYRAFQVTKGELVKLGDVIKLLETRLAIESEMAAYAASRRTTNDIIAIRAALRAIEEHDDDPQKAAEMDIAFHQAIGRATQNAYFVRLIEFLGLRLVPPRTLFLRDAPVEEHRAYVARVRQEHDDIVDAIVRMDVAGAREAARRHMQESLNRHIMLSTTAALAGE